MKFEKFIEILPEVSTSPLAFTAYIALVIAWLIVALKVNRSRELLQNLEKLPEKDRLTAFKLEIHGVQLRSGISPEQWITSNIHKYVFIAFLALCSVIVIIFSLTIFSEKKTKNEFPIPTVQEYNESQKNRVFVANDVLKKNATLKNKYISQPVEILFPNLWGQFFENGRIIYNVSEGWSVAVYGETMTFNRFPTYEALISSGRGMTNVHWDKVNELLEEVPGKHQEKYRSLIKSNQVRGGIGTLYLKEKLYGKLGNPLGLEFYTDSALLLRSPDWFLLAGIKNRDGDIDNYGVFEFNTKTNRFQRYASIPY